MKASQDQALVWRLTVRFAKLGITDAPGRARAARDALIAEEQGLLDPDAELIASTPTVKIRAALASGRRVTYDPGVLQSNARMIAREMPVQERAAFLARASLIAARYRTAPADR